MKFSAYSILLAVVASICLMSTSINADNINSAIASEEKKNAQGRTGEVNRNLSRSNVELNANPEIVAYPAKRAESGIIERSLRRRVLKSKSSRSSDSDDVSTPAPTPAPTPMPTPTIATTTQSFGFLASIIAPPNTLLQVIQLAFDEATKRVLTLNGAIIFINRRDRNLRRLQRTGTFIEVNLSNVDCATLVEAIQGANRCVSASIEISTNDPDVNVFLKTHELQIAVVNGDFRTEVNKQNYFALEDTQVAGAHTHTPSSEPSAAPSPALSEN